MAIRKKEREWCQMPDDRNGERIAKIEGMLEQMDKRLSNVEGYNKWIIGILITMWVTIIGAILFK
ncbi:hypothetical protein SAMN02746089_02510 [Caldanaerobius fijiensis DSM 17918]|uniref:Haemolysin XhlA n=1 Tax=Caldanaerobius fijiensis DSM 17918 TaxID=1121256 RepID=A0A1M5EAW2_9THEO|nr:hypothetical protein [Caldanaerobius fijiensis]SHF76284.1 hypothetical protein SAMN02746089_02510 [Caldanaerobius fijiensis DSM 17918]